MSKKKKILIILVSISLVISLIINSPTPLITKMAIPDINNETKSAIDDLCKSIVEHKPDKLYKELGDEYFFKIGTNVVYLEDSENEDEEYKRVFAKLAGRGTIEGTCTLLLQNFEFVSNVPLDRIEATDSTEYERIN